MQSIIAIALLSSTKEVEIDSQFSVSYPQHGKIDEEVIIIDYYYAECEEWSRDRYHQIGRYEKQKDERM